MSTAVVTVNSGLFRGLNLRQKTLLIIGSTSLLLLAIVISSIYLDGEALQTNFGAKNLAPFWSIHSERTGWEEICS
ncbi:hypothetical protein [Methanosarcina thermophila]|uniref:hypothetical protein n=1 Tax=Methanosarcina thermophila TaxID=2210 RepID=UPI000B20F72D|nr:hypothetical protein [Methanosarcina thermophila]